MDPKNARNCEVALCLSGGGLRATLFHLGVIRALRAHQIDGRPVLPNVTQIYSVSGGSILAAHMLLRWDNYKGTDDQFEEVAQEVRRFAQRNIRDRVLRRWFLTGLLGRLLTRLFQVPVIGRLTGAKPGLFSRTYWLQKEYDALLEKTYFCDLKRQGQPTGHILTTNFRTGELCSFSGAEFIRERHDSGVKNKIAATSCGPIPLSFAVAASSAFPPLFPPIELTDDMLGNPVCDDFRDSICLSDGGVFDNLGIEKVRKNLGRMEDHPRILIISDAGGSFRSSSTKSYSGVLSRNIRASDILMHRIADQSKALVLEDVKTIPIRISTQVDDTRLDRATQQRLRLIRTDLDSFDEQLADLLVDHGARVAHHALASDGGWPAPPHPSDPPPPSAEVARLDEIAELAARRSYWRLPLDKDWTVVPLLTVVIAFLYLTSTTYGGYVKAKADRAAAETAKTNKLIEFESVARQALDALRQKRDKDAFRVLATTLQETQTELESNDSSSPAVALPTQTPARAVPYTQKVYMQFAVYPRRQIAELNARLRNADWNVQGPSGERTASASGVNEVRYSGENRAAAQALADAINQAFDTPGRVKPQATPSIPSDLLDVWLSR